MSFAVSSMALQGFGAANTVIGSYYGAESQKSSLNFQAGIADINARMAEQSAQQELQRGEREYQNVRLRTASLKSRQRVSMAANGVDLGVGTAVQIQTGTDIMGEIDAKTVESDAVKRAWGFRTQATQYKTDASMKRSSASGIDPGMAAFSSLVTEGAKIGSSYMGMKKAGLFDAPATPGLTTPSGTGLDPSKSSIGLKSNATFWGN